jgi:hypothetical protein
MTDPLGSGSSSMRSVNSSSKSELADLDLVNSKSAQADLRSDTKTTSETKITGIANKVLKKANEPSAVETTLTEKTPTAPYPGSAGETEFKKLQETIREAPNNRDKNKNRE